MPDPTSQTRGDLNRFNHQPWDFSEPVDPNTPRSLLEEAEEAEPRFETECMDRTAVTTLLTRLVAWISDTESVPQTAMRVWIVARKLALDDASFAEIGARAGFCRSAAHKVSKEFEETFGHFRCRLDKSADHRAKLSAAWFRAHHKAATSTGAAGAAKP